jgi:hypothetical protein
LERAQGFGPFAGPARPRSSGLASSTPLPEGEAPPTPRITQEELELLGTGLSGTPPQGFWNVGTVGAGMDPSIFNGKEYERCSGDAVNRLIGDATAVREIDRAELLAAIRDMGVPLEMVDPIQVGAALNFINEGASGAIEEFGRGAPQTVDEQRERLVLALRQFRYLAEHGPARMDRSLAINVMWSAARIPGHAFETMSDREVLAMAQKVAAACNTPGHHELKVGRHTVKLTIGEDNTVLKTETKPPSAWEAILTRVGSAVSGMANDIKNIALGVFKDLFEAAQTFAGGVWDLARGRFGSGLKGIGLGLLKVGLTGLDAGALAGLSGISFVQTALGLEPVGRKLTAEEISVLRPIFGDSVDYGRVRIKTEGFKGVFSLLSRNGFTRGDTIYFRDGAADLGLLIHEMTHVWQYQNGGNALASEDIWAVTFGEGYRYENALARGLRWRDLNPEQQAQFLQDAYDPALGTIPRRFVHSYNGVDYDYTAVLEEALRDLRAGRGAP